MREPLDVACLARVPVFAGVDFTGLADAARRNAVVHLARDEVLFHRGEQATGFYFVESGRIQLTVANRMGSTTTVEIIGADETFGEAVLVSGHDLRDLEAVLEATAGTGVSVYTHGELLPANSYPGMTKYPHLIGNYGGAWQDQQSDFAAFPGAILMTSNCIIEPAPHYRGRIFTTGPVGWPGVRHLEHDFGPLVQAARALPDCPDAPEKRITIGFGHAAVLSVADQIVAAVREGALERFFLVGGCDGAAPGRNYYTDFAENTPDSTAILTLGCAKYRFNDHDFGDIGGIPRLLDIGRCNDSYSAIQIALALADAFDCGVNDLPLTIVLSWFEQKATAVLLTLLALGIRGITVGPTLPVYLTPAVLDVLVDKFALRPIGDARADVEAAMSGAVS